MNMYPISFTTFISIFIVLSNVLSPVMSSFSSCKMQKIAIVLDSTRLVEEPIFEIVRDQIAGRFFPDLERYTRYKSTVSVVVYHQNNNCYFSPSLHDSEYIIATGDEIALKFRGLGHYQSSALFNMTCAKENLMWQLEKLGVGVNDTGVGLIFQRKEDDGFHLSAYYMSYSQKEATIFDGPLLHSNVALVLPSTNEISINDFNDDKLEAAEHLDSFQMLLESYQMSGLVYFNNKDCFRTGKWTSRDYFSPTQGSRGINKALRNLQYHQSVDSFQTTCAEELLFSQQRSFSTDGVTGILFHTNDDVYIYYNRVKIMEVDRFAHSWFKLVCDTIDKASASASITKCHIHILFLSVLVFASVFLNL